MHTLSLAVLFYSEYPEKRDIMPGAKITGRRYNHLAKGERDYLS